MSFEVAFGTPHTVWLPVDVSETTEDTNYVGSIVYFATNGVAPIGAAAGVADNTNKRSPLGIVVGTNNGSPVFSSTYKAEYITAADTQALLVARDYFGAEGMWSKGDPIALVQVALIDSTTILKGSIYTTTLGVAPTVQTASAASTDGFLTAGTLSSGDFTPVAEMCSIYCRTGANAGCYRITDDTSTTAPTCDIPFPYDVAIGDTFIRVPFKLGVSTIQLDAEALFVDNGSLPVAAGTARYFVDVVSMNLREAGKECVYFRFSPLHFDTINLRSAS